MTSEIQAAFARRYAAECERMSAIGDLRDLGVIRSKVLVGDLGELVAANFYGGELAPVFTEGYDVLTPDGRRVQVKGMPGDQGKRTIVCRRRLSAACDLLFAVRFADDYTPLEALEVPRDVADDVYGDRGVHWTGRLTRHEPDRVADRLGQVKPDGVGDLRVAAPVQQLVAGARRVDAQQQLDR